MKKKTQNYLFALTVALLPLLRYLDEHFHILYVLLAVGVCLFFLLRGFYYHLLETKKGRNLLRKLPFLNVPEETEL